MSLNDQIVETRTDHQVGKYKAAGVAGEDVVAAELLRLAKASSWR